MHELICGGQGALPWKVFHSVGSKSASDNSLRSLGDLCVHSKGKNKWLVQSDYEGFRQEDDQIVLFSVAERSVSLFKTNTTGLLLLFLARSTFFTVVTLEQFA